jgi:dihydroorotate dehydrogenase (NAD+) catalytic subunit
MIPLPSPHITRVVISTALGLDGRGIFPYTLWPAYRRLQRLVRETGTTVLTKSATRHPRRGNFLPVNPFTWKYIQRLPNSGMLNAYGLTNAGVALGLPGLKNALDMGLNVIPNFYPEFAKGTDLAIAQTLEAIALYREALGLKFGALELNFSCPNADEEIRENVVQSLQCCRMVRRTYPELGLIAKISICHPLGFAQELEALGVHAIHAVNTIPYALVFPPPQFPPSPLAKAGGGGVSGGPAFAQAYAYNRELRQKVKLHLIMGCGVTSLSDAQRYFDIGADSVSICTLVLRNPGKAAEIIRHCGGRAAEYIQA